MNSNSTVKGERRKKTQKVWKEHVFGLGGDEFEEGRKFVHHVIQQNATSSEKTEEDEHCRLLQVMANQLVQHVEGKGTNLILHHLHVGTSSISGSDVMIR